MAPRTSLYELQDFGLAFGERVVLRCLNLSLPARGCTVLLGPSGTGKSTLLRALAGMHEGQPGLRIRGRILGTAGPAAMVTQKVSRLVSQVQENLLDALPAQAWLTREQQLAAISAFARLLGQDWLPGELERPVVELPLHAQRIVAILREALREPDLLMIDEPTAALTQAHAEVLNHLIRRLSVRMPVLVVTHHLGHARALADHVVLMASGVIQEFAAAEQFFSEPQSEAGRQFLRTGSCPEEPRDWPDDAREPDGPEAKGEPDGPATPSQAAAGPGPRGFHWLIPRRLAGTPVPGLMRDVDEDLALLREAGVTRLVSLTEVPFDARLAARHGIRCDALAVDDMRAPDLSEALALCQRVEHWMDAGEAVALHCRAGLGRTGAMLAACWIWQGRGSVDAAAAVARVRGLSGLMIQSAEQLEFIDRFAALVRQHVAADHGPVA